MKLAIKRKLNNRFFFILNFEIYKIAKEENYFNSLILAFLIRTGDPPLLKF